MLNSVAIFICPAVNGKYAFWENFFQKVKYTKFGDDLNLSCFLWKIPYLSNLVQIILIVCLKLKLVPGLI